MIVCRVRAKKQRIKNEWKGAREEKDNNSNSAYVRSESLS